jgi:hypothetical protein
MAITGLRWVMHGEWPDGGATMLNSQLAQLQMQQDGGPWQTIPLVLKNAVGEERDGGMFMANGAQ